MLLQLNQHMGGVRVVIPFLIEYSLYIHQSCTRWLWFSQNWLDLDIVVTWVMVISKVLVGNHLRNSWQVWPVPRAVTNSELRLSWASGDVSPRHSSTCLRHSIFIAIRSCLTPIGIDDMAHKSQVDPKNIFQQKHVQSPTSRVIYFTPVTQKCIFGPFFWGPFNLAPMKTIGFLGPPHLVQGLP